MTEPRPEHVPLTTATNRRQTVRSLGALTATLGAMFGLRQSDDAAAKRATSEKKRRGKQGKQGDPGPQGPSGAAGATGPQGVAGAAGVTGPQGATGPQGSAASAGLVGSTLDFDFKNLAAAAGSTVDCQANCPGNQLFIGGGFDTGVTNGSIVVTRALPDPDPTPNGYLVTFVRVTAGAQSTQVQCYVVCTPRAN